MATMSNGNGELLHVLFLPYYGIGHIIPLVNAARLFASRGVKVTILTTTHNATLFRSTVEDDVRICGHSISIATVKFPSEEVGLPEGIETYSAATSPDMPEKVFYAVHFLLTKPFEDKIREIRPDAIFTDAYYPWTVDLAKELNIPRILYNLSTFMCYSIIYSLEHYQPHKHLLSKLGSEEANQSFVLPGLPDKIEMTISQITQELRRPEGAEKTPFDEIVDQVRAAEDRSFGIVQDTFYELEPAYADFYQNKLKKPKCYPFGPINYFASKIRSMELVDENSSSTNAVVEWLNEQKPKSVLYVSFGSMARFPDEQLSEMAKAIEASGVPFIWVLRKHQETTWMPDGFEERTVKNKIGLLIKGWAPQLTILDHPSTGGFMTHCGTNSVLEAITAGVPLITWPLFADQFYNEKQVEVLGLGVRAGIESLNFGLEIEDCVCSEKIGKAIERLMSGSEESQNIRDKATATAKLAKDATKEGGSSWNNLTALIQDIKNFRSVA